VAKPPSKQPKAQAGKKSNGYKVGYGRPPEHTRFLPGKSGNPRGRPKAQPSAEALLLEEASKLIKVKSGDKILKVSRLRALMRKLIDLSLQGNMAALRLVVPYLSKAHAEAQVTRPHEAPLSDDELAVLKLFTNAGD